ncbi:MAG: hypothetical protein ACTHZ9_07250 [Leucobacter sp.]
MGLAGALALTRDWRDKLVPALATSAAVTLSFSVTVPVEQILREPPPPAEYSDSDSSASQSNTGNGETDTGGSVGQATDTDTTDETEEEEEAVVGTDDAPAKTAGAPQQGADILYFGDWSGWNEEAGEFSGTE